MGQIPCLLLSIFCALTSSIVALATHHKRFLGAITFVLLDWPEWMSGVMLKIAIYGLIRLNFDLLTVPHWSWGVVVLFLGAAKLECIPKI